MARIITINPFTGNIEAITEVTRQFIQPYLLQIKVVTIDMYGNISIKEIIVFRIFKVDIFKDISKVMHNLNTGNVSLLNYIR